MSSFNPDDFIAGIRTAETTVTIFKRADLSGKLMAVEADLALFPDDENGEASLDEGAEKAALIEKRDELQADLQESAEEFTLRAVSDETVDRLSKEARKACTDRADQAAKDAAGYAREECRRAEVGDKNDIRDAVRRASSAASNSVIQKEIGYYVLAEVIVDDSGQPIFTPEQMRTVAEKLGAPQVQRIQEAFYDLSSSDPSSFVPKSQRPGPTDEG